MTAWHPISTMRAVCGLGCLAGVIDLYGSEFPECLKSELNCPQWMQSNEVPEQDGAARSSPGRAPLQQIEQCQLSHSSFGMVEREVAIAQGRDVDGAAVGPCDIRGVRQIEQSKQPRQVSVDR